MVLNSIKWTPLKQLVADHQSGKPEVYLLPSKDNKAFHNALEHDRVMTLVGGEDCAVHH